MKYVYRAMVFLSLMMIVWSCGREDSSQLHIIGPDSVPPVFGELQTTSTVTVVVENDISERTFQHDCGGVYIKKGVVLTAYHCVSSEESRFKIVLDIVSPFSEVYEKIAFDVDKVYRVDNSDIAVLIFKEGWLSSLSMLIPGFPEPLAMIDRYPDKPLDVWAEGLGGTHEYYDSDNIKHIRQAPLTLYAPQHLDLVKKSYVYPEASISLSWWEKMYRQVSNYYASLALKSIQNRNAIGVTVPRPSIYRNMTQNSSTASTAVDAVDNPESYVKSSMICSGDSGAPLYTIVDNHVQVVGIITSILMVPNSIGLENNEIKSLNILERNLSFFRKIKLTCSHVGVVHILADFASEIRRIIYTHFETFR
ncbi:MAG: trypsin-like serine protease [Proteobacteria bacterium]|nr:trypsin-like serine protease [Pseudomonadota bacterium]